MSYDAPTNSDDIVDLRDVIERVEELREEFPDLPERNPGTESDFAWDKDGPAELAKLLDLLDECRGMGGDEQWEGAWYPVTLIRDSYFENYAQELADGIGAINSDARWPNNCIDWARAARELQADYTSVDFDGETYWCR